LAPLELYSRKERFAQAMIKVLPQPEPPDFDHKVRQKGFAFLGQNNLPVNTNPPPKFKFNSYWTDCIPELYSAYHKTCAYLAIYIEYMQGGVSVDHYLPKTKHPAQLAYECTRFNSRKLNYADVVDPFTLPEGSFHLELNTGKIYVNPNLNSTKTTQLNATLKRLKLDEVELRKLRAQHYTFYITGAISNSYLQQTSPFVYSEALRQGLL
jgi:hypothetical protein